MKSIARIKTFLGELKRRKVFHVGSIYLVTAWGASLGAAELFPAFGVPDWGVRAFVITAALGLPIALVLAWAFEITHEGVVLDPGRADRPIAHALPPVQNTTTTWFESQGLTARWLEKEGDPETQAEFFTTFVIGRDAAVDLRMDNNRVSRRHARVFYADGGWLIEDLGSRNGTTLNGQQILKPTALGDSNDIGLYDGGPLIHLAPSKHGDETVMDTHVGAKLDQP